MIPTADEGKSVGWAVGVNLPPTSPPASLTARVVGWHLRCLRGHSDHMTMANLLTLLGSAGMSGTVVGGIFMLTSDGIPHVVCGPFLLAQWRGVTG